eukprot:4101160-Ditylum_brightwellii.AAC.1
MRSIEAELSPDETIRTLSNRILQLSEKLQYVIKLISCVGSSCIESTIVLFIDEIKVTRDELLSCLDLAIHERLLIKEGPIYRFTHDQIQSATYSLIPEDERCLWHLK